MFNALQNHNHDFDWYSCESGIKLDSPDQGISGKAYIRMKKDSVIWSVVKKLGQEGARILITPDSYATIYRLDGAYQKGNTEDAFAKMGITLDFADAQQAIFGNVIIPDSTNMTIHQEGPHYVIKSIDQDLQLKYWINGHTMDLDEFLMIDYRGREIKVDYSDYRELDSGQRVPFYRHFVVPFNEEGDAEIFLKIKKIEINVPKKTKFSIPNHYDRIY